jgi:hypothetical protein
MALPVQACGAQLNPVKVIAPGAHRAAVASETTTNLVPSSFPLLHTVVSPKGGPSVGSGILAQRLTSEYGLHSHPLPEIQIAADFFKAFVNRVKRRYPSIKSPL